MKNVWFQIVAKILVNKLFLQRIKNVHVQFISTLLKIFKVPCQMSYYSTIIVGALEAETVYYSFVTPQTIN